MREYGIEYSKINKEKAEDKNIIRMIIENK